MPQRPVPQSGADTTERDVQAEVRAGIGEFPQHHLALLLRYAIDKGSIEAVQLLFDGNPKGVRSRHVIHNMGKARTEWLREKGFEI